jgi:hypothetical protein
LEILIAWVGSSGRMRRMIVSALPHSASPHSGAVTLMTVCLSALSMALTHCITARTLSARRSEDFSALAFEML